MRIAYLGPKGTFTEKVVKENFCDIEQESCSSIYEALHSVENNFSDKAVVPIENSTEGTVNETLDTLIFHVNLYIEKEIYIPVVQNFLVKKGYKGEPIQKIFSHPQAIAQSREFLRKNYPDAEIILSQSTSEAAKIVEQSSEVFGSIGGDFLTENYNVSILHKKIQDNDYNFTKFIVVSANNQFSFQVGDKISVAFSTKNKPGELYKVLDIFSLWDLNMTKIVSRPMKNKMGEYVFYVDIEDFKNGKDVEDALTMVERKTTFMKILGSYKV